MLQAILWLAFLCVGSSGSFLLSKLLRSLDRSVCLYLFASRQGLCKGMQVFKRIASVRVFSNFSLAMRNKCAYCLCQICRHRRVSAIVVRRACPRMRAELGFCPRCPCPWTRALKTITRYVFLSSLKLMICFPCCHHVIGSFVEGEQWL